MDFQTCLIIRKIISLSLCLCLRLSSAKTLSHIRSEHAERAKCHGVIHLAQTYRRHPIILQLVSLTHWWKVKAMPNDAVGPKNFTIPRTLFHRSKGLDLCLQSERSSCVTYPMQLQSRASFNSDKLNSLSHPRSLALSLSRTFSRSLALSRALLLSQKLIVRSFFIATLILCTLPVSLSSA